MLPEQTGENNKLLKPMPVKAEFFQESTREACAKKGEKDNVFVSAAVIVMSCITVYTVLIFALRVDYPVCSQSTQRTKHGALKILPLLISLV